MGSMAHACRTTLSSRATMWIKTATRTVVGVGDLRRLLDTAPMHRSKRRGAAIVVISTIMGFILARTGSSSISSGRSVRLFVRPVMPSPSLSFSTDEVAGRVGAGNSDLDALAFHVATTMQAAEARPCSHQLPLIYEPVNGWGDQLRGIVTVFYVALMTCKTFKMHWTHDFKLDNYFDTAFQVASPDDVRSSNKISIVNDFEYFKREGAVLDIAGSNTSMTLRTNAYQWVEVVRHPAFRATAELYNLAGCSMYELFVVAMRVLLPRPSARVRQAVNKMLLFEPTSPIEYGSRRHRGPDSPPVIGVQIRTGGIGEGWEERRNHRHPLSNVSCFATEAERLCSAHRTCTIYLTTDSRLASSEFKRLVASPHVRLVESQGHILHTSLSKTVPNGAGGSNASDVWEKTFVDWTALSQVDTMLMSRSGFGWTAAWAGPVPYVRRFVECAFVDIDKSDCPV